MHKRPKGQRVNITSKIRMKTSIYFCLAIISGLICDRVVRPAESDVSFGDGLIGNLVLLDLLNAADGVSCSLLLKNNDN